jgi:thiol-disulfide isomerase/thioredoxin
MMDGRAGKGWQDMSKWSRTLAAAAVGMWALTSAALAVPKAGDDAPAIVLNDLDGKGVAVPDLKGKVIYVDFWATWCPPCRAALPHTQQISQRDETNKGDLVVLGIGGFNEDADTLRDFQKANNYTFRTLLDAGGNKVAESYGVQGIPTFVIIGRDGKIAWLGMGFEEGNTPKEIDKALADALAKPAP